MASSVAPLRAACLVLRRLERLAGQQVLPDGLELPRRGAAEDLSQLAAPLARELRHLGAGLEAQREAHPAVEVILVEPIPRVGEVGARRLEDAAGAQCPDVVAGRAAQTSVF